MKETERDIINLRSEEVQELMGQPPSWILRWGCTLVAFIFLSLVAGTCFIRHPDTLQASIVISVGSQLQGQVTLSAKGAGKAKCGQAVKVRLENYPDAEFGFVQGRVDSISPEFDERGNYQLFVSFPNGLTTNYGHQLPLTMQLVGSAEIIIEDKLLIEDFLQPIKKVFCQ
jgi:hypothetical protein